MHIIVIPALIEGHPYSHRLPASHPALSILTAGSVWHRTLRQMAAAVNGANFLLDRSTQQQELFTGPR